MIGKCKEIPSVSEEWQKYVCEIVGDMDVSGECVWYGDGMSIRERYFGGFGRFYRGNVDCVYDHGYG